MKKFELTDEFITDASRHKLFRIKALASFGTVSVGDLGGFVEKEENLSNDGSAWVSGNARVFGNARVSDNAQVSGDAWVFGDTRVFSNASISGNATISGNARVYGKASISGNASVSGDACVYGKASISGNASVSGDACIFENAQVSGDAWVSGAAQVSRAALVSGDADYAVVTGFGRCFRATTFFRCEDKIIRVQCGCFYGDLVQFREIVKKTHGDSKYAKEYLAIADLMELHFSDEKKRQEASK